MTVEQIAIRQEIRQMLGEAGITQNVLKEMVKDVLEEQIQKACIQAFNEKDVDNLVSKAVDNNFVKIVRSEVKSSLNDKFRHVFNNLSITVDIKDDDGTSIVKGD